MDLAALSSINRIEFATAGIRTAVSRLAELEQDSSITEHVLLVEGFPHDMDDDTRGRQQLASSKSDYRLFPDLAISLLCPPDVAVRRYLARYPGKTAQDFDLVTNEYWKETDAVLRRYERHRPGLLVPVSIRELRV